MDGKTLARIGAVVFVGVAITAAAIEMTRTPDVPETRILRPDRGVAPDGLRRQLRRCRDMGEAATRDVVCLKAWAENRARFLKQDSKASAAPSAPTTLFPTEPAEDPIARESAPADRPALQAEPSQPPVSPDRGAR